MDSSNTDKPIPVTSKPAPPDKKAWDDYILEQHQKTPARIEDAAKFVATMISISLTLFLAIGNGQTGFWTNPDLPAIKLAVITMILALIVSFVVLFPFSYKYVSYSNADIKRVHKKITKVKFWLLFVSSLLFLAGLGILGVVLV